MLKFRCGLRYGPQRQLIDFPYNNQRPNYQYKFSPKMLSDGQIHIMELLPCGAEGPAAPLRCHVRTASLSSNPDYEAVSYVWGDSRKTETIEIDGRGVPISANLAALLRSIRHPGKTRHIWADQICIDQDNVREKTAQVHMMGDIYSMCRQCLIWMGEMPASIPPSDVEAALHLLEFMAGPEDIPITCCLSSNDEFKKVFNVLRGIHPLGNSWWSRIWTVQEVILPQKKTIIWGLTELQWELLSKAMHSWITRGTRLLMGVLSQEDVKEMNVLSSNVTWINEGRNTDLPSILAVKWRGREATHLCDKVFGLRGLIRHGIELEFTTRYNCISSAADVYSAFTLDAIIAQNSLQPLVLDPRLHDDIATEHIPNWAMDLKDRFISADALLYKDWAHDHYNACNGRVLDQSLLRNTAMDQAGSIHVLGVSGVKVDKVQIISPEQCTEPDSDLQVSKKLQNWYQLAARNRLKGHSASDTSGIKEEFCRLVVGDILEARHNEARSLMPTEEVLEHAWRFVTEARRNPGEIWIKRWHMPSQLFYQVFFLTASGLMGLGPWDTRVGDEVWIFNGGNNPFMIRRRHQCDGRNEFDFVGCAYVQGIMFGEWYQKQARSPQQVHLY